MGRLFNEVLGASVEVPDSPSRIVSFSPAATETLTQIGVGERIAGVSAFCARPEEAKKKRRLGSYNTVRDEVLDELKPVLIITVTGYQRDFALRLSKKYPVYPLELPLTAAGIVDFVVKVGLVAGATEEGRRLAGALLRRLGSFEEGLKLSGYVEIDLGGPVTFGSCSYITAAFRLLGCSTIFEQERAEWLTPDLQQVATANPDVIIHEPKMFAAFDEGRLASLVDSRGWQGLRAVKRGNLYLTPGPLDFLTHHGPSFITDAMPWLEGRLRMARERLVD